MVGNTPDGLRDCLYGDRSVVGRRRLIIEIDGVRYLCSWKSRGWSHVIPVIKRKKSFLGFPLWWKFSNDDRVLPRINRVVETMLPPKMKEIFEAEIRAELAYRESWAKFEEERSGRNEIKPATKSRR